MDITPSPTQGTLLKKMEKEYKIWKIGWLLRNAVSYLQPLKLRTHSNCGDLHKSTEIGPFNVISWIWGRHMKPYCRERKKPINWCGYSHILDTSVQREWWILPHGKTLMNRKAFLRGSSVNNWQTCTKISNCSILLPAFIIWDSWPTRTSYWEKLTLPLCCP